jgi:single-strand DNA-binding protein
MSLNINHVFFAGNLTKDPEIRTTPSGKSVCNFSIASNKTWKDSNGVKQEDTTFMNCTAWEGTGNFIAQYFHKGDPIYVEGSIKNRSWDKPDGTKGYATDINVQSAQFVAPKSSNSVNNTVKALEDGGMIPAQDTPPAPTGDTGIPF